MRASTLEFERLGPDVEILAPAPALEARPGSLTWIRDYNGEHYQAIQGAQGLAIVAPLGPEALALAEQNSVFPHQNPRLLFAVLLDRCFSHLQLVVDGAKAHVGPEVEIGEGTVLHPGAVIHSGTKIGRRCVIGSNTVIGGDGFGYVRDEAGELVRIPHVGIVVLEDDVEVGANTCIDRAVMGETRVGRGTKIDNLVHVAHGVQIGQDCVIVAGAELSGSVVVEDRAWVGPNACTLQNIRIGKGALVGAGAVVIRDVPPGATVAGSPARSTKR